MFVSLIAMVAGRVSLFMRKRELLSVRLVFFSVRINEAKRLIDGANNDHCKRWLVLLENDL